jgi:hypothetical protein
MEKSYMSLSFGEDMSIYRKNMSMIGLSSNLENLLLRDSLMLDD